MMKIGKFKTRDGKIAEVTKLNTNTGTCYPYSGIIGTKSYSWTDTGRYDVTVGRSNEDIMEEIVETKKHKHYDMIVAWASGHEIETKCAAGEWTLVTHPSWNEEYEYRIKPREVELRLLFSKENLEFLTVMPNYMRSDSNEFVVKLILKQDGQIIAERV